MTLMECVFLGVQELPPRAGFADAIRLVSVFADGETYRFRVADQDAWRSLSGLEATAGAVLTLAIRERRMPAPDGNGTRKSFSIAVSGAAARDRTK
jgi:hypothetical protein